MVRIRRLVLAAIAAWGTASNATALELTSPDVVEGHVLAQAQVYSECGGANIAPALSWTGAPDGTRSFAVTLYDPDAGGGWWHWLVFDIPPNMRALERDAASLPAGSRHGQNDFGSMGYGGACPPAGSGLHHYRFTVWAMPASSLPFDSGVTGKALGPYLAGHSLAHATLTATYER